MERHRALFITFAVVNIPTPVSGQLNLRLGVDEFLRVKWVIDLQESKLK